MYGKGSRIGGGGTWPPQPNWSRCSFDPKHTLTLCLALVLALELTLTLTHHIPGQGEVLHSAQVGGVGGCKAFDQFLQGYAGKEGQKQGGDTMPDKGCLCGCMGKCLCRCM